MKIYPEKTAIKRGKPSRPLKDWLAVHDIKPNHSFYDYGCGRGDDFKHLQNLDYTVKAWDKYFPIEKSLVSAYQSPKVCRHTFQKFNTVLLTYVICTIEDWKELEFTVKEAWSLVKPKGQLVISTRKEEEVYKEAKKNKWISGLHWGYITKANTFQGGWSYRDLEDYCLDKLNNISIVSRPLHVPYTAIYLTRRN